MAEKKWESYQAIYVHIPFCLQKCLYCDFVSYPGCSEELKKLYVDALCKEIKQTKLDNISHNATIYFGGGTPSILSIEQISRIVDALRENRIWQAPQEATIEVNPGTVDLLKLKQLCQLEFSRISMGIQSLNNKELKAIGRIHNAKQALEALQWAQRAGFKRINADLIYGLPGQTLASLKATLEELTATSIDHISIYGLILEEGTPLEKLVNSGKVFLPEEDCCEDMYDYIQQYLKLKGFYRYEVSNYARKVKDITNDNVSLNDISYSRHNDVYWRYQPYLALGAGAVSFDGVSRYTRPAEITDYVQWVQQGCSKNDNSLELLNAKELLGEYMMMGLRRLEGVDIRETEERFGVNPLELYKKELEPFFMRRLLKYDENTHKLSCTEMGLALGNQIFAVFV